ncbi:MAG: twitching motility protein PilT [Chloroflexi bacterium]|nr:twitching motility protein PilT [Chloroflexota bacterium]
MAGLTYDCGALLAGEQGDRRLWAIHARALQRGVLPIVPTAILAQAWRGGPQPGLARLLGGCHLEPLVESAARNVGAALARSSTTDVPDATVVISALQRDDAVVTSDRTDLERIARVLGRRLNLVDV